MVTRAGLAVAAALVLVSPLQAARAADDPYRSQQYGLDQVGASQAWRVATGTGQTIAVVDSGVDATHPDLRTKIVAGHDFVEDDDVPQDEHGHGTLVAGVAAAVTANAEGIAGVAPDARIMPVRVLGSDGTGRVDDVAAGIRWAADHGARVINLSLAGDVGLVGSLLGDPIERAAAYAFRRGALVVVASGNTAESGAAHPSGYTRDVRAVVVTATDRTLQHPPYANRADTAWSLAAPGDAIISTFPRAGYRLASGTSMAAPHVAGVAALLFSQGLGNASVVERLLTTARPVGDRASDGAGIVDARAAVGARDVAAPAPSAVPPTGPPPPTTRGAPAAGPQPQPPSTSGSPAVGVAAARSTTPALAPRAGTAASPPKEETAPPIPRHRDPGRTVQSVLAAVALGAAAATLARARSRR